LKKTALTYNTFLAAAAFFALLGRPANAQQASAAQPAVGSSDALQEIVVTATRRQTNLQTTPVAVSAITEQQMQIASPHDIRDLAEYVPNFSAANINGFNAASFAIRGLGQTTIIVYFESPVAVLVDDFVIPSVQTQLLDTFDMQQIEVLRGPQGTLFGKNTTGGAIAVHTQMPQLGVYGVQGEAGYGSYESYYVKGAVNLPIGNTLALRLVGTGNESDGYYKAGAGYGPIKTLTPTTVVPPSVEQFVGTSGSGGGESLGGEHVINARAKLLFQPSDTFKTVLQGEYLRDDSASVPAVNESPAIDTWPKLGVPGYTGSDPLDHAGINTANSILNVNDSHVDVQGVYLNTIWNVGVGTINNVAGYRAQQSRLPFTNGGTPPIVVGANEFNFFDALREDHHDTAQEELRFASQFDSPANFVSGLFYQYDTINFCVASTQGFQDLYGVSTPFGPYTSNPRITCSAQKSTSYAPYTEITYAATDKLKFTAGGRYTTDKKEWMGRQMEYAQQLNPADPTLTFEQLGDLLTASVYNFPTNVVTVNKTWHDPTEHLGVSYQWTNEIFSYLSFSHGYKAGGFNDQIGNGHQFGNNLEAFAAAAQPTNPEYANSYEGGLKTQFFDNRLRANLTAFWVNYSDLQRQAVVPLTCCGLPAPIQTTLFLNAAAAQVKGLEGEFEAVVTRGLTMRAVFGYENGSYSSYTAPGAGYNLATAPMDRTPRWSWAYDATYITPLSNWGQLTLDANVDYVGKNLYSLSIVAPKYNTYLDERTLFNASIALSDPDNKYYLKLIGRNLANRLYSESNIVVAGLYTTQQYGAPRYIGVEIGAKF